MGAEEYMPENDDLGLATRLANYRERLLKALKERDEARAERDAAHDKIAGHDALLLQARDERDEARAERDAERQKVADFFARDTPFKVSSYARDGTVIAAANSPGLAKIALERLRQITEEGYGPETDAQWTCGELVWAAMAYATPDDHPHFYTSATHYEGRKKPESVWVEAQPDGVSSRGVPLWPKTWGPEKDHPYDRALVIAGALIAAEIDRRAALPKPLTREEAAARLRGLVKDNPQAAEALDLLLGGGA